MNKTMAGIAGAVRERKPFHSKLYTVSIREDGNIEVLYRGTLCAVVTPDKVFVNTGGWLTATTKNVINAALFGADVNGAIFQRQFQWSFRRWDRETYDPLNESRFANFDRFALPILINGRGGLTEAESVA